MRLTIPASLALTALSTLPFADALVVQPGPGESVEDYLNLLGGKETGGAPGDLVGTLGFHRIELPAGMTAADAQSLATQALAPIKVQPELRTQAPEAMWMQDTLGFPDSSGLTSMQLPDTSNASSGQYMNQPLSGEVYASTVQMAGGATSVVAVLGTGLDPAHPVFSPFDVQEGWDFVDGHAGGYEVANGVDDDGDGFADEAHGHGTHLSGIVLRVNPHASILPQRVLDDEGNGDDFTMAAALVDAVNRGAQVVLLAGATGETSAVLDAAIGYARSSRVDVFVPVGNTGSEECLHPSETADAIGVAALDFTEQLAPFSAYGEGADLAAPGVALCGPIPGGGYAEWSGTTMAAAAAAGAASLLDSVAPSATITGGEALLESAQPVTAGTGRVNTTTALVQITLS